MNSPIRKKPLPLRQQPNTTPDHKGKGKEKAKTSAFDALPREIIQEYVYPTPCLRFIGSDVGKQTKTEYFTQPTRIHSIPLRSSIQNGTGPHEVHYSTPIN